jgi:CheY-like chemotaxis protein
VSEWTAEQQHNIRTALNGIMGFASILQQESLIISEEKLKTYVGNIRKNGSRLIKLIEPEQNQNTLFSRKVNLSVFDPLTIIQKLISKYTEEALSNDLSFKVSEVGNIKVLSDQGIFEHILDYFFQKAVLFCRNEVILIKLEKIEANLLQVEIDDIGHDLPDSIRKWLDEHAEHQPYISNSAVLDDDHSFRNLIKSLNKLDASLKLSRSISGGDIACLIMSSIVERPEIDVEFGLIDTIRQHKPAILVVEDERINAQIISVYLKDLGEVTIAYTGNEAINLIRQHEMVGSVFDIIIMDIGLPEPWNGVTLKEHILRSWSHYNKTSFIAQTAYVHEDWTSFIESGQFAGFLTKPINRLELLFMINKLLK